MWPPKKQANKKCTNASPSPAHLKSNTTAFNVGCMFESSEYLCEVHILMQCIHIHQSVSFPAWFLLYPTPHTPSYYTTSILFSYWQCLHLPAPSHSQPNSSSRSWDWIICSWCELSLLPSIPASLLAGSLMAMYPAMA